MNPQPNKWDATLYDDKHNYVAQYGEGVLPLLNSHVGERILDVGCGTGQLTAKIAESSAQVIGLDHSPDMIEQARSAYPNIEFHVDDATDFHFPTPFDAVFSNAALHWIHEPEKVLNCIWDALVSGGRFVAEFGGKGNVGHLTRGLIETLGEFNLPTPDKPLWYFPSSAEYATLMEQQGFRVTYLHHFDRPTQLQGDEGLRNFLQMFVPQWIANVPAEQLEAFFKFVENRLRPHLWREDTWYADYVRLRVVGIKP